MSVAYMIQAGFNKFDIEQLKINTKITFDLHRRKLEHIESKRWLYPNPKCVLHDIVGIAQVTADTIVCAGHIGLPGQVACKQQTGANFVLV